MIIVVVAEGIFEHGMEYFLTEMREMTDGLEGEGGLIHALIPPAKCHLASGTFFLGPEIFQHQPYRSNEENDSNKNCKRLSCDVILVQLLDQQELKPLWFLTVLAQWFVCKTGSPRGIILSYFSRCCYIHFPLSAELEQTIFCL